MKIAITLSPMSPIRCALSLLLLLISTSFVQTTTVIDILYTDERVLLTPKTDWTNWTYNGTVACPGIWTSTPDENHMIDLNFTGVGITVYGYAEPRVAPWKFQIDDEPAEVLSLQPNVSCRAIRDRQGLKNGRHRMKLTPLERSFVLTKFSVTQDDDKPTLTTGEIAGIVVGGISALLAIPGVYFGFKAWSQRRRDEMSFNYLTSRDSTGANTPDSPSGRQQQPHGVQRLYDPSLAPPPSYAPEDSQQPSVAQVRPCQYLPSKFIQGQLSDPRTGT